MSLINASSLRKYILYALGEIFLVMIGILLALWVNSWNRNKMIMSDETRVLLNLRNEFIVNRVELGKIRDRIRQCIDAGE